MDKKSIIKEELLFAKSIWRSLKNVEIEVLLIFLIGILGIGTIFYSSVENWSLLDSLYFSVITLTTVGFGDFTPQTEVGKAFTIVYVLIGIFLFLVFLNSIVREMINAHTLDRSLKDDGFFTELKKIK
mgnify:CR=1 FL=1